MASNETPSNTYPPIQEADLLLPFERACKPKDAFRIGAEGEKIGVFRDSFAPVHYQDSSGKLCVKQILLALAERYGWSAEGEYEGAPIIALTRRQASITLEPGAQLELSGAPLEDVHAIALELQEHLSELHAVCEEGNIAWLGLGFHPFAKPEELDWVPKLRYGVMREYLPTRGQYGLDMMRRTCTVQANYDYESESDAMRKMAVGHKLAPLTAALFANSPFVEGALTGELSQRARVWLDVDSDRSGVLPMFFEGKATFEQYVQWALQCPMFLIKRGSSLIDNRGQSFLDFLKNGFQGQRATMTDWETHLNTLFPEVRLKRTIEIRGADSQGTALYPALPALFTGLFYDQTALAKAEHLLADVRFSDVQQTRPLVPKFGLQAPLAGKPLQQWAELVLDIAKDGLIRRSRCNNNGQDESVYLRELISLVSRGETPSHSLLKNLPTEQKERYKAIVQLSSM